MPLLSKIQNRFRGLKQKWASPAKKRELWNEEFSNGRWDSVEDTAGDVVYQFVEKYAANGSILDLGCGSGNTGCELNSAAYSDYLGVDISDVALAKAARRSQALQRADKNAYLQGDIETFSPSKKYDVILFRESIYYLPKSRIKPTLERYAGFLKPQGVMIIRLHDPKQGEAILSMLETERITIEKVIPETGPVIFVLR